MLRKRDKRLGDSLGWIVDILLQDEETTKDIERLRKQRREAIESLSYIRDVLISDASELEEERLVGEQAALAKRTKEDLLQRPTTHPPLHPPIPVPHASGGADRKVIRASPASFTPNRSIAVASSLEGSDTPPLRATPFNPTRSSFSRPAGGIASAALPRKPPPTSSSRPIESKGGGVHGDPLGVYTK